MTDTKSLQDLVNRVNSIDQKIEAARLYSLSMFNGAKPSEFDLRFNVLMRKYSEFAEEYKVELGDFHQSLLKEIKLNHLRELQKQNELERIEINKQIDVISNSGTAPEIIDNSPEVAMHSPATSIKYVDEKSDSNVLETPPLPIKCQKKVSIKKPSTPKTIRKIATPHKVQKKAIVTHRDNRNNQKQHKNNALNVTKQSNHIPNTNPNIPKPYQYDAKTVQWKFNKAYKSSTMIFIGNLPTKDSGINITDKGIEYFVMQRAHVTKTQIEQIILKRGARGMYALVRFSSDVSLQRIKAFIQKINTENEQIYKRMNEEKNKNKIKKKEINDKRNKGKNKENTNENKNKNKNRIDITNISWKKRVFVRFNRNVIKSGDAMWYDQEAKHTLFIQNFDILNSKCHYELTETLLQYGELYEDISMNVDSFGDPYCVAIFKYINDAIWCRNAEIEFNERMLQIKYSKY